MREGFILGAPAKTNRNHKGYDYLDSQYGEVNVKGAVPNKRGVWIWEIKPTPCDNFALVKMSEARVPETYYMISNQSLQSYQQPGL